MPTCRRCEKAFPNHVVIEGSSHNLQNRKFCLECSPFGSRGKTQNKMCPQCQTEKPRDAFYARPGGQQSWCKECFNRHIHVRQKQQKQRAIDLFGGACQCCGYNRYVGCLDFHHTNGKKDFIISSKRNANWESILRELQKCVLVCKCCHGEIHAGLRPAPPTGFEPA
jgi:hypothetical protein